MSKAQYQQKPTTSSSHPQSSHQQRRVQNRPQNNYGRQKYQDKDNRYKNKFGFDYDENKIGYNTEIPQMPQKPKAKPDDAKYNKKIQELEFQSELTKKTRKEKKDSYKNGSKTFTDKIQEQKKNIDLAKACLVLLDYDKNIIHEQIEDVESKINTHKRKIDFLSKPTQKTGKNVKIEEMSYADLVREEDRITHEMSTRNLSKAEEVELSNKLNKIKKRKVEVPKESAGSHVNDDKLGEVQSHRNSIQKLRRLKQSFADKITDIDNKIESIEEDIQDFEQKIEQIHHKLRNTDNSKLLEEAAKLKEQIYAIWDEMQQLHKQHQTKHYEYEYEQQKIKYIQWAKDVKTRKAQQWQLQKQQRKRQKLKQKDNKKKGQQKDQKAPKQGEKKQGQTTTEQKPAFQRKKINRNQKEIDACSFLIQYCKDLNAGDNKNEQKSTSQKDVKLEDALKKGEWAKMKDVQVIQSKKKKEEEAVEQKAYKKKENKNPVSEPTDRFSHTYFVAQVFDSVKVLPPTKQQDIEKVVNELQDKMQYYIAHPDEGVEKSLIPTREGERQTKTRGPRKVINTEQFPSLR